MHLRCREIIICVALAKEGLVVGPLRPSVCPVRPSVRPQHFLGALFV